MPSPIIQSVLLSKDRFKTARAAQEWIDEHQYDRKMGIDITNDYYRFRQRNPDPLVKAGYRIRSVPLKDTGYLLVAYARRK